MINPAVLLAPLLLFSSLTHAGSTGYALHGIVAIPSELLQGATVVVNAGIIKCVGDCEVPEHYFVLETNGIIFPGLVDAHNHYDWNVHPRWNPPRLYSNRYEWQKEPSYIKFRDKHYALTDDWDFLALMHHYGDTQALLAGVTTLQGGYRARGLGLARNPSGDNRLGVTIRASIFPLKDLDPAQSNKRFAREMQSYFSMASTWPLERMILHVAEGRPDDDISQREYKSVLPLLGGPPLPYDLITIIHGLALDDKELDELADRRAYLVWSPSSNMRLYGLTLDPRRVLDRGVRLALGPDWAPTGSRTQLEEIAYARDHLKEKGIQLSDQHSNERELVLMATERAAEAVGLGDHLGRIAPGYRADFLVLRAKDKTLDPYKALAAAGQEEIALVTVDGEPMVGDTDLVEAFALPENTCITKSICGGIKELCIHRVRYPDQAHIKPTFSDLVGKLKSKIPDLAPVTACR